MPAHRGRIWAKCSRAWKLQFRRPQNIHNILDRGACPLSARNTAPSQSTHACGTPKVRLNGGTVIAQVAATPGTPATRSTVALGNCMCDVTLNLCDPNCCCDVDCTSVRTQRRTDPQLLLAIDLIVCSSNGAVRCGLELRQLAHELLNLPALRRLQACPPYASSKIACMALRPGHRMHSSPRCSRAPISPLVVPLSAPTPHPRSTSPRIAPSSPLRLRSRSSSRPSALAGCVSPRGPRLRSSCTAFQKAPSPTCAGTPPSLPSLPFHRTPCGLAPSDIHTRCCIHIRSLALQSFKHCSCHILLYSHPQIHPFSSPHPPHTHNPTPYPAAVPPPGLLRRGAGGAGRRGGRLYLSEPLHCTEQQPRAGSLLRGPGVAGCARYPSYPIYPSYSICPGHSRHLSIRASRIRCLSASASHVYWLCI